jgi:hypothetical protein
VSVFDTTNALKVKIFNINANAVKLFGMDVNAKRKKLSTDYLRQIKMAYLEEGPSPSHYASS